MAAHDKSIKSLYKQHPMSGAQAVNFARKRRHSSKMKRIAITVIAVIAVLAALVAGSYLWFTMSLNSALDRNTDKEALQALAETKSGEPFYVLLLASDSRAGEHGEEAGGQQTDVMMLARIDAHNKQVTLLSIPRDTPYKAADGTVMKMNALYSTYGLKQTIQAVSELTGVPISHYVMVYMSDLKNVVDTLGGVEVTVENEINNDDPETEQNVHLDPGTQTLNGTQAQAYAISRHDVDTNQDEHRQTKIRTLISAIIDKVLSYPAPVIPGIVVNLAQYVQTDMRADDLVQLAVDFATGSGKATVYQGSGPSDGDIDPETGMWLCYENPAGWAEVISVVDSGGDPSTVKYND